MKQLVAKFKQVQKDGVTISYVPIYHINMQSNTAMSYVPGPADTEDAAYMFSLISEITRSHYGLFLQYLEEDDVAVDVMTEIGTEGVVEIFAYHDKYLELIEKLTAKD